MLAPGPRRLAQSWARADGEVNNIDWYYEKMSLLLGFHEEDELWDWSESPSPEFVKRMEQELANIETKAAERATKSINQEEENLYLEGKAAEAAWKVPYQGTAHDRLKEAIRAANENGGKPYTRFFAIIQSSGMGKSRAVDEVAKALFTIPFNIRLTDKENAYPLPDDDVREHFLKFPDLTRLEAGGYFLLFFAKLFEVVREVLETSKHWGTDLPLKWYAYLKEPTKGGSGSNRCMLYREAIKRAVRLLPQITQEAESNREAAGGSVPEEGATWFKQSVLPRTRESLATLLATIESFGVQQPQETPSILMYFDECHTLSRRQCQVDEDKHKGSYFDALCSALNSLSAFNMFSVFLSTNSSLEHHAPPWNKLPSSRGNLLAVHAPFTELSFDCHPNFPIFDNLRPRPHYQPLTLDKICGIEFMCSFGRPLFWTRYGKIDATLRADDITPFASSKLRCNSSLYEYLRFDYRSAQSESVQHTDKPDFLTKGAAARLAVLDLRVLLDFEPNRPSVAAIESQLVESHMRVAYSVPAHREYCISGYPSEPVLAEAAAQLMGQLRRKHSAEKDVVAQILAHHIENGLISKGERCEMVARLLLTLAYDRAHDCKKCPSFSVPVSVAEFFLALLGSDHWEKVRISRPDNLPSETSFEDAFKHAKVRFTHFNRSWDDSGSTVWAALAGFLRGMAIQCHPSKEGINIVIPLFFESEDPNNPRDICLPHISGILISVKNRDKASSHVKVRVDATEVGFFPPAPKHADQELNPYIVIVMELGVQPSPSKETKSSSFKHDVSDRDIGETDSTKRINTRPMTPAGAVSSNAMDISPSKVQTEEGPKRVSSRATIRRRHPRYTVYIHGCSPSVYPVIGNKDLYAFLLGSRKLFSEHPRQDAIFIEGLKSLKPVWSAGRECYSWFDESEAYDNGRDIEEGVSVGINDRTYEEA